MRLLHVGVAAVGILRPRDQGVPAPRLMSDLPSLGRRRCRGLSASTSVSAVFNAVFATLLAQGEGAVGVGAALSRVGNTRQRGGYVIAGVAAGVHAPIDGEKTFTCLASILLLRCKLRKKSLLDGAVRVNQRVGVRVAGP